MPLHSLAPAQQPLSCRMYVEPFFTSALVEFPIRDHIVHVVTAPSLSVNMARAEKKAEAGCAAAKKDVPVSASTSDVISAKQDRRHPLRHQVTKAANALMSRISGRTNGSEYQLLHDDSETEHCANDVNTDAENQERNNDARPTPARVTETFLWKHIRSLEQGDSRLHAQRDYQQGTLAMLSLMGRK